MWRCRPSWRECIYLEGIVMGHLFTFQFKGLMGGVSLGRNPKIQNVLVRWHIQFLWWNMFQNEKVHSLDITPKWFLWIVCTVYCRLYNVSDLGACGNSYTVKSGSGFLRAFFCKKRTDGKSWYGSYYLTNLGTWSLGHLQGLFCHHDHHLVHRIFFPTRDSGHFRGRFIQQVLEGKQKISPDYLATRNIASETSERREASFFGRSDRLSDVWNVIFKKKLFFNIFINI